MLTKTSLRYLFAALALVVLAGCSGEDEPVEIAQHGERPAPTEAETTTTTAPVTTTSLPVAVVEIPELPSWGQSWPGPSAPTPGSVDVSEFDRFLVEEAPAGTTPEEAVAVYLQLDPTDPSVQMLVSQRGGPESIEVTVVQNTLEDDSTRALRWSFAVEVQARDSAAVAAGIVEESESGDEGGAAAEESSDEGDAADEEQLEAEEGPDEIPLFLSAEISVQCQPGRGHQDFTSELCA
jgi:hypothetical protein